MSIIELRNLTRFFSINVNGEAEGLTAIQDISLSVRKSEFISIIGPSGCGKSTILELIAGLQLPTDGVVRIEGEVVLEPPPTNRDEFRAYQRKYRFRSPVFNRLFKDSRRFDVSMVFQDHSVFPWKTALENILFALRLQGVPKPDRRAAALKALALVGLSGFENKYPYQLSGGMRQRVALARALAIKPKILLMDEPFGMLDAFTRERLQDDLLAIRETTDLTIIYVTHDIDEAVYLSDRIAILTTSPGMVRNLITVPVPRPRRRGDRSLIEIRDSIQLIFRADVTGEVIDYLI
jgi:NitT/TauT family transport system ATP-binding protein